MKEINPEPSSLAASARMKATKSKNTLPELRLRKILEEHNLCFEMDAKPIERLPRKADFLFRKEKIAIFVDGCFWHGCPEHGTQAKHNINFWKTKIYRNKERDSDTNQKLIHEGWRVLRAWEHEDPQAVLEKILKLLQGD